MKLLLSCQKKKITEEIFNKKRNKIFDQSFCNHLNSAQVVVDSVLVNINGNYSLLLIMS